MKKYPKIYLALDNCFAIKRWPKPSEWARIVREEIGGINYIEASTDLEIDPQFCPDEYTKRWIEEVKQCENKYDLSLASFYSGYVTYRSVSLLNWEKSYRDRFLHNYVFKTIDLAKEFNAVAGGALQAFSEAMLQNPEQFSLANKTLMDYAVKTARYAAENGVSYGFEQMYTPTQGWWRIKDVKQYIYDVYKTSGMPLYTTIDTAHMAGQSSCFTPGDAQLISMAESYKADGYRLPDEIIHMIKRGTNVKALKKALQKYEHWFSEQGDEDLYKWLEELSCYSPVMHLQQTDGTYSSHRPFTSKYNEPGIVHPRRLLQSIVDCYDKPIDEDMPPRATEIYLAFEIFFGATDSKDHIISSLKESVSYWREVIREDGKSADVWL